MSILGRPVAIKGHIGKYLTVMSGHGCKFASNHVGMDEQWLIMPIDDGRVIIQHLKSKNNL